MTQTEKDIQAKIAAVEADHDPEDDGADDEAKTRRTMDSEIRAMSELLRVLDRIPESARSRVVAWLTARFNA